MRLKMLFFNIFSGEIYWDILEDKTSLIDYLLNSLNVRYIPYEELNIITDVLTFLIDHRSPFTRKHSESIEYVANAIAKEFNIDNKIRLQLRIAAKLHDIGKMQIPINILEKPGGIK